jgi:hypothetical protein
VADKKKADRPLLGWQKNDVFQRVQAFGFEAGDFHWDLAASPGFPGVTVEQLIHDASEYFFVFDLARRITGYEADRASYFSPGPDRAHVATTGFGWDGQLEHVAVWLASLRKEVDTVSLWDTFGRDATREMAAANLSNKPLSKEQRQAVELRAGRVRSYLRATIDDRAQLDRVERKVDDLIDASKRLGVKDFASVSLGILMTIAVEAALNPHQAQELVNLFFGGLRALLGS